MDTQGRWWLDFGSFWSGIKMIALNPSTGLRADSSIRSIAGRNGGPIEAPYIFHHGDYYYLGGFNWSSQHFDLGGVRRGHGGLEFEDQRRSGGSASAVAC